MSSFTQPLVTKHLPGRLFEVYVEFEYHLGAYPSDSVVKVPKGFVTDLASIPRLLWVVLPPIGKYDQAAALHDYYYQNAISTKLIADRIFLEALEVLKIPKWKRKLMYLLVRLFGKGSY